MSRKLVWIDQQRFRGFGCSDCGWQFKQSGPLTRTSFDEMLRNFELQRDKVAPSTQEPRALNNSNRTESSGMICELEDGQRDLRQVAPPESADH
jgi:hypothetical protein